MGILSGMLLAAGIAFFSKKKLSAKKNEDDIKKEPTPNSEHKNEEVLHQSELIQTQKTSSTNTDKTNI